MKEKRKAWKQWKNGGTKEGYLKDKETAKTAVFFAKRNAQTQFASSNNSSNKNRIFQRLKDYNETMLMSLVKNVLEMMMES